MLVYAGYFLAFLGLVFLALALYIWRQGDADFVFDTGSRTQLLLEKETADEMVFSFSVPFRNRGSQQGTLMDVFVRPWMPMEQFSAAELTTKVTVASCPRSDGYWEATLFPNEKMENDVAVIKLQFRSESGDIRQAMSKIVDLSLNIIYQVVGRSDWYLAKVMVDVMIEEFQDAITSAGGQK